MAVDEFGREIPGRGGGRGSGSGPSTTTTSMLDSPLLSSRGGSGGITRYHRGGGATDHSGESGGDHHPPPEYNNHNRHNNAPYDNETSRYRNNNQQPAHASPPPKGFTAAAPPIVGGPQQQQRRRRNQEIIQNHPSYQYIDEPLLCQFLWKEEQKLELRQQQQQQQDGNSSSNPNDPQQQQQEPKDPTTTTDAINDDDEQHQGTNNIIEPSENNTTVVKGEDSRKENDNNSAEYEEYKKSYCLNYIRAFFNQHLDDSWFRLKYSPAMSYQHYVYIQQRIAFVEADIITSALRRGDDDNTAVLQDFLRTVRLSGGIKQPSNNNNNNNSSTTTTTTSASAQSTTSTTPTGHLFSFQHHPQQPIGGGVRSTAPASSLVDGAAAESNSSKGALHLTEISPYVTDSQLLSGLALHVASLASKKHTVRKVTATNASATPASGTIADVLTIIPTATMSNVGRNALQRDAVVIADKAIVQEILRSLANDKQQRGRGGDDNSNNNFLQQQLPRKDGQLPRKGDVHLNSNAADTWYPMDVECSDPYGRLEYDADGRGASPPDGLPVPIRKAVVMVSYLAPHQFQTTANSSAAAPTSYSQSPSRHHSHSRHHGSTSHNTANSSSSKCVTVTLSAALSSRQRWAADAAAAMKLAAALDRQHNIPIGSRLEDVVPALVDDEEEDMDATENGGDKLRSPTEPYKWTTTDRLDVAIAYLRRVHFVSFYQGCVTAESVADIVTGKSPVSTIYMRLHNADEVLALKASTDPQPEKEGDDGNASTMEGTTNDNGESPKDLLVRRLDDGIVKALAESESNHISTSIQQLEQEAELIQQAEIDVQQRWLSDHAITDADGRARCSFAFCHKLFKDSNFLYQHLLKKHTEYLHAEQAKCHDTAMMKAWDEGTMPRLVPDVLIDCGVRFGTVAAPVLGGPIPNCIDPEPELWRREEERQQREAEMKARRNETRQQQYYDQPAPPAAGPRPRPTTTFVDVDDMKEEKVELSFDSVPVPAVTDVTTLLKKKKKRKLL